MNVRKHLDVEKHFFRNSSFTCIFNYNFETKLSVYEPYVKKRLSVHTGM